MKYMLHIALLASTLTAHHSAQTAVKTQTVSRALTRPSARAALRSGTRSASLTEQDLDKLGSQEGVPLNVEQLQLAQTIKPTTALNLDAQEVVSDRIITRSAAYFLREKQGRKDAQKAKNRARAMAKRVVKSRS